ncbi:MAG: Crp/Fnr family transcriptional regulator [Kofleriaceae bacterium]|nr:Crp/Fnr family transcriptional regulator [Kofleriaceae bacterium]MCL4222969.1 Crp/Fnr family transcriptional regulator [Myxococcales bacterium]
MLTQPTAITSCSSCPCGQAAGVRWGGRCPLVDRKRRRDETLALEGQPIETVWFVKRGTVVLSRSGPDGIERPRLVRGPGTFLGLEVLVRSTYADTMRTTEPTIVCGISRDSLDAWLGPKGSPARMALEQTLVATADDRPRAAGADGTALKRVARWILDDAAASCRVPRHVVAALLGMVPETLSRSLAQLHDDGLIAVTRRSITVTDRPRLEELGS